MGRKSTGGGVEVRERSIRLTFTFRGRNYKETLKRDGVVVAPTAANVKFAQRLALEIKARITAGQFDLAAFFPDSAHAEKDEAPMDSFGKVSRAWLVSKGQLEDATRNQYATALRVWDELLGADTPMQSITHQVLAEKVGGTNWPSAKTANNYLVALRGVMRFYYAGPRSAENPMAGISNLKVVKKRPDPLSASERDLVLDDLRKRYDARVWAYFAFAFATGARPEEIIALRWGDIDVATGTVRVQRVRTFRGSERDGSKTHTERDIDLTPAALEALAVMKPYTYMKGSDIFENPVTGKPWHDERSQRDHYWHPTLRRLGVRERRAYCTRHTYATVALMGGINPAYVASQLGHASTKMFFETYSRWISGADKGLQKAQMAALFGAENNRVFPQTFPEASSESAKLLISNEKIGRRDWTRTKKQGNEG